MNIQDPRKVFGETLVELGKTNERIVVLEADLGKSTMSTLFQQAFPERYFEMGISEQNMTSFARVWRYLERLRLSILSPYLQRVAPLTN